MSSFSANLYVPWPEIYYSLANRLSVVSLQFLKLPTLACVQPEGARHDAIACLNVLALS